MATEIGHRIVFKRSCCRGMCSRVCFKEQFQDSGHWKLMVSTAEPGPTQIAAQDPAKKDHLGPQADLHQTASLPVCCRSWRNHCFCVLPRVRIVAQNYVERPSQEQWQSPRPHRFQSLQRAAPSRLALAGLRAPGTPCFGSSLAKWGAAIPLVWETYEKALCTCCCV